jgi:SagB-type dehydrogenase family enzyme
MKSFGGTYRFLNKSEPLSALKSPPSGEWFTLWKPDMRKLSKEDISFSAILEERTSIRDYDEQNPITARQLGEFLYRVGRIKEFKPKNPAKHFSYEVTLRPYPAGGGCYELEIYLIIRSCQGFASGLYYYDPKNHRICKISDPTSATDQILLEAKLANGRVVPQVLICLAARFSRVSWKYESIAYATILKNVGVLYQTMYLVATAMGLAPCALGGGNSDLFAQVAGTDYYAETSVGEFMLGSKKRKLASM